ncbi:MAG: hypothetical protein DWQ29_12830 [Planctomycetota bacterium]|nr:MAG: hypothetical protein DWQ29_12830 [Planctomycetota bacterium]
MSGDTRPAAPAGCLTLPQTGKIAVMGQSIKRRRARKSKPEKPYPEFPLFPHASGRWAKKIRGKFQYFGKTADDPEGTAALQQFNREWPYLSEGRSPPPVGAGEFCNMRDLCNAFLTSKRNKMIAGELSPRSFRDYHATTDLLIAEFGRDRRVDDLRPNDFERFRKRLAERFGPVALKGTINVCRIVFKYAHDQRLIDDPVSYGQSFARPSVKALRKSRNEAGPRLFERHELLTILSALDGKPIKLEGEEKPVKLTADPALTAMVLLGVNAGFGNTDCASLPQSAVDLAGGWIEFPRPKTEIERRIPLWPETVAALMEAIEHRVKAKNRGDEELCFLTKQGNPWVRVQQKADDSGKLVPIDALSQRFANLLGKLKINGRRGLGFYTLRHVFETIAGESRDQVAVNAIMGHVDTSMAAVYRERISDERLQAVVEVVRQWLFDKDLNSTSKGREPQ